MSGADLVAALEALEAARDADDAARRAAITPHVRRVHEQARGLQARKVQWGQEQAQIRAGALPWQPETYCGAAITTEDWDRRTAASRAHAAAADAAVCPTCLTLVRQENARA